jgi:membrane protein DedA with SNARE-associated domain
VPFITSLDGLALLAAVGFLVFVEECGVPLPFAPGDLLLAVCGLAIAAGRLNPVLAVGVVYGATVVGAMCGREVFSLAGSRILHRFYGSELPGPLERVSRILHRGGWPAVMLARLTPGLRVSTTELAGLLRVRRTVFAAGLLPAAAVYVSVFVGLGALFGESALRYIEQVGRKGDLVVVVLAGLAAVVVVVWAVIRPLARRRLRRRRTKQPEPTRSEREPVPAGSAPGEYPRR